MMYGKVRSEKSKKHCYKEELKVGTYGNYSPTKSIEDGPLCYSRFFVSPRKTKVDVHTLGVVKSA